MKFERFLRVTRHGHFWSSKQLLDNKAETDSSLQAHKDDKADPHDVTKTQVGLSNADNTSDVNKPVSAAAQTALDLKADKSNVLELDNAAAFTPDADYEPATKKYVDDSGGADPNAIHDNVASEISAITEKVTLVDNDLFVIEDSADSNNKKRVKKSNVGGGGASSKTYLHLTMAADQTSVVINDIVEFDESIGNITFDSGTHKATLLEGKTYRLTAQLRANGTSGHISYQWWDYTNSAWLTGGRATVPRAVSYSNNYGSTQNVTPIASVFVTPASDISVGLKIYNIAGLNSIRADNSTWGYVEEK